MPKSKSPTTKPPKKKKGFLEGYRTYDATQGFGSVNEWRNLWERMSGSQAKAILQDGDPLIILGLSSLPTEKELDRVFRKLMLTNHPDKGGTHEQAKSIIAAYTLLKAKINPNRK